MSKRKYSIHRVSGYRLTDKEREILGTAWNNYIRRCRRISLRLFAKIHGVPYEKGAIENCNRLVRRWYPKGTDFNRLTRREIMQLEAWINSIHRESLNGETAYAYDSRLAQVG